MLPYYIFFLEVTQNKLFWLLAVGWIAGWLWLVVQTEQLWLLQETFGFACGSFF
jgi:hypothetical protein